MPRRDLGLALLVVAVWGLNFVVIEVGLRELPPLLFVGLRFLVTALPAVFLVRRPDVPWRVLVALGLLMCVGQFGFLFTGMSQGMPAGLTSVVMQSQALFTVLFAAIALRERPRPVQLAGLAVAAGGMVLIGLHRGAGIPGVALMLLLAGAACWGAANVVTRAAGPVRPLPLLVWSSLVAPLPLFALSALLEGPARDVAALRSADLGALGSLAYVVVLATFGGFGIWYWLLGRHPSSLVAPFSLLVPVTGLSSAWLLLGEDPSAWQLAGCALAVGGVALVVLGGRRAAVPASSAPAVPLSAP